jgi:hypothetical protein
MKRELVALLLVSLMVASAFGAIAFSETKAEAATATHIQLYTTNAYPAKGATYYIYGYLRDSNNNPVRYRPVAIWYRYSEETSGRYLRTVTTDANGYFSTYASNCKTLGYRAVFSGDYYYAASKNPNLVWVYFSRYVTHMHLSVTGGAMNRVYMDLSLLTSANSPVAYRSVDIWYRKPGETVGHKLTTITTDANGQYSSWPYAIDYQSTTTYYRAVFSGDCTYWGSRSELVTLSVS